MLEDLWRYGILLQSLLNVDVLLWSEVIPHREELGRRSIVERWKLCALLGLNLLHTVELSILPMIVHRGSLRNYSGFIGVCWNGQLSVDVSQLCGQLAA